MSDIQATTTSSDPGADGARPSPDSGHHEDRPLAAYSTLTGVFGASFATALFAAYRRRGGLPERPDAWDVVTASATTYKVSRLVTKAKVTGFIRAPFVRFEGEEGRGEVSEAARGSGLRYAVGELLVCPHCLAQWIAGAITVGYVGAPRLTRLLTFLYTVVAASDFGQIAYRAADQAAAGVGPDET